MARASAVPYRAPGQPDDEPVDVRVRLALPKSSDWSDVAERGGDLFQQFLTRLPQRGEWIVEEVGDTGVFGWEASARDNGIVAAVSVIAELDDEVMSQPPKRLEFRLGADLRWDVTPADSPRVDVIPYLITGLCMGAAILTAVWLASYMPVILAVVGGVVALVASLVGLLWLSTRFRRRVERPPPPDQAHFREQVRRTAHEFESFRIAPRRASR